MYERFTDRARKVMRLAKGAAMRRKHEYIGSDDILLGLIEEGGGMAGSILRNLDIAPDRIRTEVERMVPSGSQPAEKASIRPTPRAKQVIEYAIEEARALHHNYVDTEHLLLGLLRDPELHSAGVLNGLGLDLETARREVLNLLKASFPPASPPDFRRWRRAGTWVRRHSQFSIFVAGLMATLVGGVIGISRLSVDKTHAAALGGGVVFIAAVAFAHLFLRPRKVTVDGGVDHEPAEKAPGQQPAPMDVDEFLNFNPSITDRSRAVIYLAAAEAHCYNPEAIGTGHLLVGLMAEGIGVAAQVLKELGADVHAIRLELARLTSTGPAEGRPGENLEPPLNKIIEDACEECRKLGHRYAGTEHLLLAVVRQPNSLASQVLRKLGIQSESVRKEVLRILGHSCDEPPPT